MFTGLFPCPPLSYLPPEAGGRGGRGPPQGGGGGGSPTRNRKGGPFLPFFALFWRFLPKFRVQKKFPRGGGGGKPDLKGGRAPPLGMYEQYILIAIDELAKCTNAAQVLLICTISVHQKS